MTSRVPVGMPRLGKPAAVGNRAMKHQPRPRRLEPQILAWRPRVVVPAFKPQTPGSTETARQLLLGTRPTPGFDR